MEFVTFHVALGSGDSVHPNQTLKHKEYLSMIDMMFASARLFHPDVMTTVLTDRNSSFDDLSPGTAITRFDIDPSRLMLERASAQLKHVLNGLDHHPMIVLDSDILINASLVPIFEQDFDVAVTWRQNVKMPINGGFLILNNIRPEITKRFFNRFVSLYQEKYADEAAWFGDQLALRDLMNMNPDGLEQKQIVDVDGCRVLLLPCDTYNYSPENKYKEICSKLSEKVVLHFKGERKRLMPHFWNAWLKPSESYFSWIRFDAWRERWWLRLQARNEKPIVRPGSKQQ